MTEQRIRILSLICLLMLVPVIHVYADELPAADAQSAETASIISENEETEQCGDSNDSTEEAAGEKTGNDLSCGLSEEDSDSVSEDELSEESCPEEPCEPSEADRKTGKNVSNDNDYIVKYVAVGGGTVHISDGMPVCEPYEGYDLISVRADAPAGGFEAGEEIPFDLVSDIDFPDGTTVFYEFEFCEDMQAEEAAPSYTAEFEGICEETAADD